MQVVLLKVTAKLTKTGLVTTRREIVGNAGIDPDVYLDRLARILTDLFNYNYAAKEVAAAGLDTGEPTLAEPAKGELANCQMS